MSKVYVFDHPLIQHKVALMRQTNTSVKDFRELARELPKHTWNKLKEMTNTPKTGENS